MSNHKLQFQPIYDRSKGSVLIVVIWIVLVLASLVIVLAHYIRTETLAAANYTSLEKAEAVALGAIQYVCAVLDSDDSSESDYEGEAFESMKVGDGYFWIISPNLSDDENFQYGLVDEAGKININEASVEMLLKLPEMSSELANSLIDWRDDNEEVTTGGAENEYYLLLSDQYQCKNAPLESVEEVLLIKGGSKDLLYGEDTNRNGILDWNEDDGDAALPSDNSNGSLDSGFFNYVTIHSYQPNSSGNGSGNGNSQSLINVSSNSNRSQLIEVMSEVLGESKALEIMAPIQLREFSSLIEFYYFLGIDKDDYVKIIDRLTVSDDEQLAGKINISSACEEVLLCLPGLDQSDVDKLIKQRSQTDDSDLESVMWVTDVLDQEKAVAIGSYITAKSYQYSVDIVAVSGDGRAYCRYYVVIDTAEGEARVKYKQCLSQLGFPLDSEILDELKDRQEL